MRLFNFLWFVFFGWFNALLILILSGFMAMTIIGFPIAKSILKFSKLSLFPFGKEVIRERVLKEKSNEFAFRKIGDMIAKLIWFPFALLLTIVHFLLGIIMISTVIGFPIGIVYVKIGKFILKPIGTRVIFQKKMSPSSSIENEIEKKDRLDDALKVLNL